MTSRTNYPQKSNLGVIQEYRRLVPPPAPIYSRWHVLPSGGVVREPMPGFLIKGTVPEGYALRDSPEDKENERKAWEQAAALQAPKRPPPPRIPPPRHR